MPAGAEDRTPGPQRSPARPLPVHREGDRKAVLERLRAGEGEGEGGAVGGGDGEDIGAAEDGTGRGGRRGRRVRRGARRFRRRPVAAAVHIAQAHGQARGGAVAVKAASRTSRPPGRSNGADTSSARAGVKRNRGAGAVMRKPSENSCGREREHLRRALPVIGVERVVEGQQGGDAAALCWTARRASSGGGRGPAASSR